MPSSAFPTACHKANDAMAQIAAINRQLSTSGQNDATTATLLDQRDNYIDQLAQLMDINVVQNDHNQVTVFTRSGIQLVGNSRRDAGVRSARLDDGDRAVERRSDEARRSAPSCSKAPAATSI